MIHALPGRRKENGGWLNSAPPASLLQFSSVLTAPLAIIPSLLLHQWRPALRSMLLPQWSHPWRKQTSLLKKWNNKMNNLSNLMKNWAQAQINFGKTSDDGAYSIKPYPGHVQVHGDIQRSSFQHQGGFWTPDAHGKDNGGRSLPWRLGEWRLNGQHHWDVAVLAVLMCIANNVFFSFSSSPAGSPTVVWLHYELQQEW